jgi:UTP--glucose-1-phosphate uridylyltransferase
MRAAGDFGPFEKKMRDAGLPQVVIDTFAHYYAELASGATGLLGETAIEPVEAVPSAEDLPEPPSAEVAHALDRAVVVKLNGGLGTSMGMTGPKSLLPVKDGLSFLDIIVRQVLSLRRRFTCRLPLVLMNSFRTRAASLELLARYEDVSADLPDDFVQHKVPKVAAADLRPVSWPHDPDLEWCPPGHGDLYAALVTSGMLDALIERGYEYAFVSNADNLGAVLDPAILVWFAAERLPFLMEVADRTEADRKGGHIARLRHGPGAGRLVLREAAQCPPEEAELFQDVTRYKYFNTNTIWLNLQSLAGELARRGNVLALPMIRNAKTVDPADPASPEVYQLETAMGAAISVFDGAAALRVPKSRFVPVKTTNDLLGLRSDVYELTGDYRVVVSSRRSAGPLFVDLDPAYYKLLADFDARFPAGVPSLVDCARFVVRGDVRFGAGVVARGSVEIDAGDEVREIPDGTVL